MAATRDAVFGEEDLTGNANGDFVCTGRDIASGRLCVFFFLANGSTATALTSVTSPNLTWERKVNAVHADNNYRIEIWRAWASSALTGEVITTDGGGSYNRRWFVLVTVDGSDENGAEGTATAEDFDGSPADPTLSVDADTGSLVLAGLVGRGQGDTTEDGNTTQEYSSGSWASFAFGGRVWSRAGQGGATQLGSTGSDPLNWNMAGIEIEAAAEEPPPPGGLPFSSSIGYRRVR
jgi:hypothetical protein